MCKLDILGPVSSCHEGHQSIQDWSTFFFPCHTMNLLTCVFVANKCAFSQSRGLIGAVKILCAIQYALSGWYGSDHTK